MLPISLKNIYIYLNIMTHLEFSKMPRKILVFTLITGKTERPSCICGLGITLFDINQD